MALPPHFFDGHNDTLLHLHLPDRGQGRSFFASSELGHIDLPRARTANYAGGFFAIFVPGEGDVEVIETADGYEVPLADAIDTERATQFTYDVLERLYRLETEANGAVRVVRDMATLTACLADDALAVVVHLEGAEAVDPDLSNLDFLYAAGVRSIGLTWSRPNAFAHGVPYQYPHSPDTGPGLTDAGRDLVRACNDRGIVLDLAHLNEAGFFDVAELSDDPLVVSHTGAFALNETTRSLTDEQLDAVAQSGGVVGITLCVTNIRADADNNADTPIATFIDHIEYVAERIGVEHVAIGTDFDGAVIPDAVGDVTGMPAVFAALRERGFNEEAIRKIASENWVRVLDETWA
ncbi:dipeptidase [Haladaptatus sp. DJG-WS-42]|uniref:dipeptidase n=1 Tax=Haladaptatus sp. DJG-WS-42 TaxID=3120516 RepID=UPI0030D5F9E3